MFVLDVDDMLCFHYDAKAAIKEIDKFFPRKKNETGDSDMYPSTKLGNVDMIHRFFSWSMSPTSKYVQDDVRNDAQLLSPLVRMKQTTVISEDGDDEYSV
jgi:hypothetical protein